MANTLDYTVKNGDTWTNSFAYTDASGAIIPLTGFNIKMQARFTTNSSFAFIDASPTSGEIAINAAAGAFVITLNPVTVPPGVYVYEIKLFSVITTVEFLSGTLTVLPSAAR